MSLINSLGRHKGEGAVRNSFEGWTLTVLSKTNIFKCGVFPSEIRVGVCNFGSFLAESPSEQIGNHPTLSVVMIRWFRPGPLVFSSWSSRVDGISIHTAWRGALHSLLCRRVDPIPWLFVIGLSATENPVWRNPSLWHAGVFTLIFPALWDIATLLI
jgi:hypothetical protein